MPNRRRYHAYLGPASLLLLSGTGGCLTIIVTGAAAAFMLFIGLYALFTIGWAGRIVAAVLVIGYIVLMVKLGRPLVNWYKRARLIREQAAAEQGNDPEKN